MEKTNPSLLIASLFLVLGTLSAVAQDPDAPLQVINGDFSDLDGMTALPHQGWYSGVPTGWTAAPPPDVYDGFFAVRASSGVYFANLHVLSHIKYEFQAFKQEVGVLTGLSDVTLTFESTGFKDEDFLMGAAIINARGSGEEPVLTKANFQTTGDHRLVAKEVPSGTPIVIQFWAVKGFPGISNVAIEVTPCP